MKTVSIIYFSGSGHTTQLAESVNKGVSKVAEITSNLIAINEKDIINGRYKNDEVFAALDSSDAIIFGTATYMGGISAQFKAFADASVGSWFAEKWKDKLAAGFTVSGTPAGDKFSTMQYLNTLAMQHGMIWISLGETHYAPNGINRLGAWAGAIAQSTDNIPMAEGDMLTGEVLGKRVADMVLRFN